MLHSVLSGKVGSNARTMPFHELYWRVYAVSKMRLLCLLAIVAVVAAYLGRPALSGLGASETAMMLLNALLFITIYIGSALAVVFGLAWVAYLILRHRVMSINNIDAQTAYQMVQSVRHDNPAKFKQARRMARNRLITNTGSIVLGICIMLVALVVYAYLQVRDTPASIALLIILPMGYIAFTVGAVCALMVGLALVGRVLRPMLRTLVVRRRRMPMIMLGGLLIIAGLLGCGAVAYHVVR